MFNKIPSQKKSFLAFYTLCLLSFCWWFSKIFCVKLQLNNIDGYIVQFAFNSPAIWAKDLFLVQTIPNIGKITFKVHFMLHSSCRYNARSPFCYITWLRLCLLKSLLTMIPRMHSLLVFRKITFRIHLNFSPLAGTIFRPPLVRFYSAHF